MYQNGATRLRVNSNITTNIKPALRYCCCCPLACESDRAVYLLVLESIAVVSNCTKCNRTNLATTSPTHDIFGELFIATRGKPNPHFRDCLGTVLLELACNTSSSENKILK